VLVIKRHSNLGFYDAWLFQDVGNETMFVSVVTQRLSDTFVQNWNERLHTSTRANFYKHISVFQFQPYLNICNVNKFRVNLSKLRMSSHRLNIETGRWARPTPIPLDQRKCTVCNKLEDEFHFILECTIYTELRSKYIPLYYRQRPNMYKFIELITSNN